MAEETPKVQDRLAEFFTDTGTFHSVIQKELQKRSLRNQRYEPEPGRPVANLSRESYDDGLNTIYGSGKDFSLSELSEDTLLDISENDVLPHRKELCLKKLTKLKNFLYMKSSFECNLRNRLTKSLIKLFLRKYSFDLLLKEKSFSKDVYYCFNSIEKNYSEHSVYLREILDLFLNTDSYSDGDVRLLLSKLEYLIYEFELDKS